MGMGHYWAFVYGAAGKFSDARFAEFSETDEFRDLYCEYEAPPWVGFFMADTREKDLTYKAFAVSEIPERLASAMAKAKTKWDDLRKQWPELPEGSLLFVADYD